MALAERLNARNLSGIRFYPVSFVPAASKYEGERCEGVFMILTDRLSVRPVRVGLEIASALHALSGSQYDLEAAARLFGRAAHWSACEPGRIRPVSLRAGRVTKHGGVCSAPPTCVITDSASSRLPRSDLVAVHLPRPRVGRAP